jgi:hypothetical protein
MIFKYVVLLHVLYILTSGIFYISLWLIDISGRTFMGKYTSEQSQLPTLFATVHRWIGL